MTVVLSIVKGGRLYADFECRGLQYNPVVRGKGSKPKIASELKPIYQYSLFNFLIKPGEST